MGLGTHLTQSEPYRQHVRQPIYKRVVRWLTACPPDYEGWQRRFMVKRLSLGIKVAVVVYFTFICLRLIRSMGNPQEWDTLWFVIATLTEAVLLVALGILRLPWGDRHPGRIFILVSWSTTLLEQAWSTLQERAFAGLFLWTLVFLTQATLIPVRWPLHLISQLGVLIYYYGVNSLLRYSPNDGLLWDTRQALYIFWFCGICDVSVALYERLKYSELAAQNELNREKEKSEQLLLNILPETIAKQLMAQQEIMPSHEADESNLVTRREPIADHFADATILFADIVGFTELSSLISAEDVVAILDTIFSEFDELAERHQLEKIKTIGDAYMVVGGLPIEHPARDHVAAIADMALDMRQAMDTFSQYYDRPLQLRIGINTGPVVAGVIGRKKFIYDLWGDAVNLASRMESQGKPDYIQVTHPVYERLRDRYHFQERGLVAIKGKGNLTTYWLNYRR
ncbi:MAG: adenylate/guanylate cyclase domain-containing protein [Cyanobacteria bacterium P01_F01_bin.150]